MAKHTQYLISTYRGYNEISLALSSIFAEFPALKDHILLTEILMKIDIRPTDKLAIIRNMEKDAIRYEFSSSELKFSVKNYVFK